MLAPVGCNAGMATVSPIDFFHEIRAKTPSLTFVLSRYLASSGLLPGSPNILMEVKLGFC